MSTPAAAVSSVSIGDIAFGDEIFDISMTGMKRAAIRTSAMGTSALSTNATKFGSETWVPASLSDPGFLKIKVFLNPDNLPRIDSSAINFQVVWSFTDLAQTTNTLWAGSGFVTEFVANAPEEDLMWGEYVVKVSGNVLVYPDLISVINDVSVNVVNDSGVLVYA